MIAYYSFLLTSDASKVDPYGIFKKYINTEHKSQSDSAISVECNSNIWPTLAAKYALQRCTIYRFSKTLSKNHKDHSLLWGDLLNDQLKIEF